MTMRLIEGFDYFGVAADVALKYTVPAGSIVPSTTTRYSLGKSVYATGSGYIEQIFDAQATWVLGVAFFRVATTTGNIFSLVDGTTIHANL